MIDPVGDNPDRSRQYTDSDPAKLRDQLNENWRQLRLFKQALADRDRVVAELHESINRRDKLIGSLNQRLALMNWFRPWLYALLGGIVNELGRFLVVKFFQH